MTAPKPQPNAVEKREAERPRFAAFVSDGHGGFSGERDRLGVAPLLGVREDDFRRTPGHTES